MLVKNEDIINSQLEKSIFIFWRKPDDAKQPAYERPLTSLPV